MFKPMRESSAEVMDWRHLPIMLVDGHDAGRLVSDAVVGGVLNLRLFVTPKEMLILSRKFSLRCSHVFASKGRAMGRGKISGYTVERTFKTPKDLFDATLQVVGVFCE